MSCWVVPTIAAELWGVSVDHILQRVRDGDLPHHVDQGFMFVDAAPPAPPPPPAVEHPPTFTALSAAEVEALREGEQELIVDSHDDADVHHDAVDDEDDDHDHEDLAIDDEESQSPDDDEASVDLGDWRAARRRIGMTRIPPGRRAKPQAA